MMSMAVLVNKRKRCANYHGLKSIKSIINKKYDIILICNVYFHIYCQFLHFREVTSD